MNPFWRAYFSKGLNSPTSHATSFYQPWVFGQFSILKVEVTACSRHQMKIPFLCLCLHGYVNVELNVTVGCWMSDRWWHHLTFLGSRNLHVPVTSTALSDLKVVYLKSNHKLYTVLVWFWIRHFLETHRFFLIFQNLREIKSCRLVFGCFPSQQSLHNFSHNPRPKKRLKASSKTKATVIFLVPLFKKKHHP